MAWTAPITFYDGDPLTSAQLNTFVRDNLNACAPAIATTAGRYIASAGKNVVVERQWCLDYMDPVVTLGSEWPSDPDDETQVGPTVTFEHGGSFLLLYDVRIRKTGGTGGFNCAPQIVDGPGELPNVYNMGIRQMETGGYYRTGSHVWVTGAEPGITTVTLKYGSTPGSGASATGDCAQRRLTAWPL